MAVWYAVPTLTFDSISFSCEQIVKIFLPVDILILNSSKNIKD